MLRIHPLADVRMLTGSSTRGMVVELVVGDCAFLGSQEGPTTRQNSVSQRGPVGAFHNGHGGPVSGASLLFPDERGLISGPPAAFAAWHDGGRGRWTRVVHRSSHGRLTTSVSPPARCMRLTKPLRGRRRDGYITSVTRSPGFSVCGDQPRACAQTRGGPSPSHLSVFSAAATLTTTHVCGWVQRHSWSTPLTAISRATS